MRIKWPLLAFLAALVALTAGCSAFTGRVPVTEEWAARLARDYPGWSVEDEALRGKDEDGTQLVFSVRPPDGGRPIRVGYLVSPSGQTSSKDLVLRAGSPFHARTTALLAAIESNARDSGADFTALYTHEDGTVGLGWGGETNDGSRWATEALFEWDDSTQSYQLKRP